MAKQNTKIPLLLSQILNDKLKSFSDLFESLDLVSFNGGISLQEYQVAALQKALCSLKLYKRISKRARKAGISARIYL